MLFFKMSIATMIIGIILTISGIIFSPELGFTAALIAFLVATVFFLINILLDRSL